MNKMKLERERELPKSKAKLKKKKRKQQFLSKSVIVCSSNQWLRKNEEKEYI